MRAEAAGAEAARPRNSAAGLVRETSTTKQPEIRYAPSGDVNIAYQVTGEGPLDLVLVPGFISHLELDWEESRHARFLERLGSFARLIRFDKRGLTRGGCCLRRWEPTLD
jgi:hypothetical protein